MTAGSRAASQRINGKPTEDGCWLGRLRVVHLLGMAWIGNRTWLPLLLTKIRSTSGMGVIQ